MNIHIKIRYIIIGILLILICLACYGINSHFQDRADSYKNVVLTDNCEVYINDTEVFAGDISSKSLYDNLSDIKAGDKLSISFVIKDSDIKNPVIAYYCQNVATKVFIDDEMVYSYGELSKDKKVQGYFNVKVPINNNCNGKHVKIEFDVNDKSILSSIPEVQLINAQDFDKKIIAENVIYVNMSISLIVMGFINLVFMLIAFGFQRRYLKPLLLSVIEIVSALWIASCFNVLEIITKNYVLKYYIEYLSLFIILILTLLYMGECYKNNKKCHKIIKIQLIVSIAYTIIATVLQHLHICYYSKSISIYHILAIIAICSIIVFDFIDNTKKKSFNQIYIIAVILLGLAITMFAVQYFCKSKLAYASINYIPYVACIFIIICFLRFVDEFIKNFMSDAEKNSLMILAYKDPLTLISNRRACEKSLEEVSKNNIACGIFIFDIDGLKSVNDSYGHSSGDELITRFSAALTEAFSDSDDFYGRFGGDEFMAIIENPNEDKKIYRMTSLNRIVKRLNLESNREYELHFSCGYAIRDIDSDKDIWDILRKADSKMYENKKKKNE